MPALSFPKWMPKDRAAPLKEEYILFFKESTRYHTLVEGSLLNQPDLTDRLPDMPDPLESFTDKMLIAAAVPDLFAHLMEVQALHAEGAQLCAVRTASVTVSGSAATEHGGPKVSLPASFDGSSAKAHTFLAECNNYINLNRSRFISDHVKIQWALQLCTDKAANWKRIQLERTDAGTDCPDYLLDWEEFQKNFRNKWADLNAKQKAQQRFLAGIKQVGSVRRYAEQFEEVVLESEFRDPTIIISAFYNGLKYEVKRDLVGKRPDTLEELKACAVTLDEERMAAQDPEKRDPKPSTSKSRTSDSPAPAQTTTRQTTTEIKAETACIGTQLSADEKAKRLREGNCFGCGEHGHQYRECPKRPPRARIAAMESVAGDPTPTPTATLEESKN